MKSVSRGLWVGMSLLVAVMGCGLGPQVQGSGTLVQEERQVPEFVSLDVEDGIESVVVVDPSQPRKVRVVGDDNLVRLMRTDVVGTGTLSVHFRMEDVGSWRSSNPLRVDVSGSIGAPFTLEASGGGSVKVRGLDTGLFSQDVSGGADVTVEGRATRVESTMSGGSVLRARDFSVEEAALISSGGGSTEIRVSNALRVEASGGGAVRIIGRPTVLQEDLSGGSTLRFE
ncbi:MAG TPA: DUF2807 domain-containing protein [Archangium sp.]|uniref:GIN domain-containing protein n=1 Tax=Archangium sp. TaxID=1872627 RepID=UPI002E2EFA68|nr:DUF2807 domain-containing protein [Archangium sp.]HEX5744635.1 DUF2807 domain-containing protein [Archangium sp.]